METYADVISEIAAARTAEAIALKAKACAENQAWAETQERLLKPVVELLDQAVASEFGPELKVRRAAHTSGGMEMTMIHVKPAASSRLSDVRNRAYRGELAVYMMAGLCNGWLVTLVQLRDERLGYEHKNLVTVPVADINKLLPPLVSKLADMVREVV